MSLRLCLRAGGSCWVSEIVGPGRTVRTSVIALHPGHWRNSTSRTERGAYLKKTNLYELEVMENEEETLLISIRKSHNTCELETLQ